MALTVSVGIVSYNTCDLLARALLSLRRAANEVAGLQTSVVDNSSTDGSAEMVASSYPEVELYCSDKNLGFAAGMNRALARANGEYLLMLNPDAELLPGALRALAQFMEAHPRVAAVGPRLMNPDGSSQYGAFTFPTLAMVFLDLFPIHGRLLASRLNGRYLASATPHPIGHPLGACMLIRRLAWEQVGPLDEQFFMYCEEIDWCLRCRRAGWEVYHVPQGVVVHHSGQSTKQKADAMLVELFRSRMKLYRKHYSPPFVWVAKSLTRLAMVARSRRLAEAARRTGCADDKLIGRLQAYQQIVELCCG